MHVPQVIVKERTKEVPKPEIVENLVEVPKIEYKEVEKQMPPEYKTEEIIVEVPQVQVEERVIHNPKVVIQERIIEVPKIEFVEKIEYVDTIEYREVPVDKIVEVPEIQYVMREVEHFIPQDYVQEVFCDRYTEVPVVQVQEVVREERVPVIVKRPIPKRVEMPTNAVLSEPFPEPSFPPMQQINQQQSFSAQAAMSAHPSQHNGLAAAFVPQTSQPLAARCMITITVLNLAALAGDTRMDPLVELRYGDLKVGAGIRTSVKYGGGRNAVWNETLDPVPLVPGNWLMCSVLDHDPQGNHEHIGEAQPRRLEAFDFDSSGVWEGPIKISKETGGGGRIPRGQVSLRIEASGPVPRGPQPSSATAPATAFWHGAVLECLYPGGIAIRTEPRMDAAKTGAVVEPGERFMAAEVLQSPGDSQQYVRLGDGRGWAITRHVGDGSPIVREVPAQQACMYGSYEPGRVMTPPPPTAPLALAARPLLNRQAFNAMYGNYEPARVLTPPSCLPDELPASDDAAVAALEAENARLRRALALRAENAGLQADLERFERGPQAVLSGA